MVIKGREVWIEIGKDEVGFLYTARKKWGSPGAYAYASVPCTKAGEGTGLTAILRNFRRENFGRGPVGAYLLIPLANGLIREIRLPWIGKRKRDAGVRYYIMNNLPVLPQDFSYDYFVAEDEKREFLQVKLAAVRKEIISAYARSLQEAGYLLLGTEYTLLAIGELFAGAKTVVFLEGLADNKVQFCLYQGKSLQALSEIDLKQYDQARYHLYLAVKELENPPDWVLTDQSAQAKTVAGLLMDSGLAKEHTDTACFFPEKQRPVPGQGFAAQVLWGGKQRVRQKKAINLSGIFLRPIKVKLMILVLSIALAVVAFAGALVWYPLWQQHSRMQQEVGILQNQVQNRQNDQDTALGSDWKKEQVKAAADLERVGTVLTLPGPGLDITRLDYKQNTLYLWLECREASVLPAFVGGLTAAGWKEPAILDYKFTAEKTEVCFSVKR
jgi:hypothetical protein